MNLDLLTRLKQLHEFTAQTPLFNPVFQLGLELSREIEASKINLDTIETIISRFECDALQTRARKLHSLLAPVDIKSNLDAFKKIVLESTEGKTFTEFENFWNAPFLHAVFTAHPTFLLNFAQSESVANAASSGEVTPAICEIKPINDDINLGYEHNAAMNAIKRASDARNKLNEIIISVAFEKYPDQAKSFLPSPLKFATWVGYDMDGRTDIGWQTSLNFRIL